MDGARLSLAARAAGRGFAAARAGSTAIEYGLIAAGITVAIAAAILLVGDAVLALFNQVAAAFGG